MFILSQDVLKKADNATIERAKLCLELQMRRRRYFVRNGFKLFQ